jgi:type III pantothenate kinase
VNPDIVVDVGNSRMKWGRCLADGVAEVVSLPLDDTRAWKERLDRWRGGKALRWAVSSVVPRGRQLLADWAGEQGDSVFVLESAWQLPVRVQLEHPDKVGIDRLLNAVAINSRRRANTPAVIVDAGSAVTVDYVDENGEFRGGAIFPGVRLMAQALHDRTALLPLVEVSELAPPPGASTASAIKVGVAHAVVGGIEALVRGLESPAAGGLEVYFGGGDGPWLFGEVNWPGSVLWPEMTLEGVRLAALESPG